MVQLRAVISRSPQCTLGAAGIELPAAGAAAEMTAAVP